jgi:hypothetical protein
VPCATSGAIECGLNNLASMERDDFFRFCLTRANQTRDFDPTDQNILVAINRLWVPPLANRRQSAYWYCNPPWVWQLDAGQNAAVKMPDSNSGFYNQAWVWIDNRWLADVVARSGTRWARTAVLAHEFAHVYLGHILSHEGTTTWRREYAADVFAGRTLRRLGASLLEAQAICYQISQPAESEDPDGHPSLSYRLQAMEEGWRLSPERSNSAWVVNAYWGDITVEIEGTRYLVRSGNSTQVWFSDPVATMLLWECPPTGCQWSDFAIPAAATMRVFATGLGADLAVVAQ